MSVLGSVKEFFLGKEYDPDEEFVEEVYEDVVEEETPVKSSRRSYPPSRDISNSKVVSIHTAATMEVVRTSPTIVTDAFSVCDCIRENKVCVVNLEGVEPKESQRIADFLGGVAYALNGDIQRISKFVFIIAPASVEITGQLRDELKESGVVFPWASKNK